MTDIKEELLKILREALESERSAGLRYSNRAEMITSVLNNIERTHGFPSRKNCLPINLSDEREAIAFYKLMRQRVCGYRKQLQDDFERLEESIRNVIRDEEEHLNRLSEFVEQLEERVENIGFSKKRETVCSIK